MKTRSTFLNYIAEYMLVRQYSLRTVDTYQGGLHPILIFMISAMTPEEVKLIMAH
jgi:hypothetical protein